MKFINKILDKLFDITEQYSRYKTAALLSSSVRTREEVEQILNDLYGPKK
jgi:hypothetical protein